MTHYLRHGILYGSEGNYPDIERFIIENTEILPKSQMMQGYLAHLIEDMLWFSIYIPRMTIEKDKKLLFIKRIILCILMMNLEMISILIIQLWIDIF